VAILHLQEAGGKMIKKIMKHVILAVVMVISGYFLLFSPYVWNTVYMLQGWVFVLIEATLLAWLVLALVFKRSLQATTAASLVVVFAFFMFALNFAHNAG
jgi:hypothetical protein